MLSILEKKTLSGIFGAIEAKSSVKEIKQIVIEGGLDHKANSKKKHYRLASSQELGWYPIQAAAHVGRADLINVLVEMGADLNSMGRKETPIRIAVKQGHVDTATALLKLGVEPGSACLAEAVAANNLVMLKILIKYSEAEDVEGSELNGLPLHDAAASGNIEMIKVLLALKPSLECGGGAGHTPLECAVQAGHCATVRFLFAEGALLKDNRHHSILSLCISNAKMIGISFGLR